LLLALLAAGTIGVVIARQLAGAPESWRIDLPLYGQLLLFLAALLLIGLLAYRVASAFTLGYELDRNGLYITWLGNRAVVPLEQIQSVDVGVPVRWTPWSLLQGIGYYWGRVRSADGKLLHLFATKRPQRCLIIQTPDAAYAISPADPEAFVQDLEQRRHLGATKPLAFAVEPSRMFQYAFWNDSTVRTLILVALALQLLMLALLAARYPELGSTVQMRFDATGQVVEPRPRHHLLFLPLAAFGLTLSNVVLGLLFYRRQHFGAQLLQGASVIVQLLSAIATLSIVR
jgi:hypothetical protein